MSELKYIDGETEILASDLFYYDLEALRILQAKVQAEIESISVKLATEPELNVAASTAKSYRVAFKKAVSIRISVLEKEEAQEKKFSVTCAEAFVVSAYSMLPWMTLVKILNRACKTHGLDKSATTKALNQIRVKSPHIKRPIKRAS
jgi:hypothetical protein